MWRKSEKKEERWNDGLMPLEWGNHLEKGCSTIAPVGKLKGGGM